MDDKARVDDSHYVLRMPLEPGRYVIRGISSMASSFPINGFFFTPMHVPLTVKEPGVYYLGRVEATVRPRKGHEFRAGPVIPLIDQSVAGAAEGTFDVRFVDDWARDEEMFRRRFPALKDAQVRKAILPPFDRAVAQTWWEKN